MEGGLKAPGSFNFGETHHAAVTNLGKDPPGKHFRRDHL